MPKDDPNRDLGEGGPIALTERVTRRLVRLGERLARAADGPRGRLVRAVPWILLLLVTARSMRSLVDGSDFSVYHAAGEAVIAGENVFESGGLEAGRPYIYPPTLAILVTPLAALPHGLAAALWSVILAAALVLTVRASFRLFDVSRSAERWSVGLLTLLVVARPLDSEFGNGQVNLVVLGVVLLGAVALAVGKDLRAGAWMGLAVCIKVTPAILLGYLVVRRRWRAVAGWCLGVVASLLVLPAIAAGDASAGARDTAEWARRVAEPFLAAREDAAPPAGPDARRLSHEQAYAPGMSLRAISFRYLTPSPLDFQGHEHPTYVNVTDVGRRNAQLVYAGLALLVVLVTALVTLRRAPADDRRLVGVHVALWLLAMLLVSPISRKAHFVAILPAIACLSVLAVRAPRSRAGLSLLGCLLAYLLAADRVTGESLSEVLREGGLYTATAFVPWLLLVRIAARGERLPAATEMPFA